MAAMVREYAPRLCGMDVQGSAGAGREEELPDALVQLVRGLRDVLPDLTLHAGELEGPASIERALALEPQGIGHGVRAVESPALLKRLARAGITLEVCPTSNALLITDSVARLTHAHGVHPLRVLLDAGVACALCTDDPANFGTDLQREHRVAAELGAPMEKLAAFAERRWAQVARAGR
jgi:adenosine deaminase